MDKIRQNEISEIDEGHSAFDFFSSLEESLCQREKGDSFFKRESTKDNLQTPLRLTDQRADLVSPLLLNFNVSGEKSMFTNYLSKRNNNHFPLIDRAETDVSSFKKVKKEKSNQRLNSNITSLKKSSQDSDKIKTEKSILNNLNSKSESLAINKEHFINPKQRRWPTEIVFTSNKEKPSSCNCKNSKCLKLYCDCFRINGFCGSRCNCIGCENTKESKQREARVAFLLKKNPLTFKPIVTTNEQGKEEKFHNRGCNCKKNNCQKNYCECYQFGVKCGQHCKCVNCLNCENSNVTESKSIKRYSVKHFGLITRQFKDN